VLLEEDDKDDYIITRRSLSRANTGQPELDWVRTYDEALEVMKRNEHEVYLLVYRLGEWNGLELLREARKHGCRTHHSADRTRGA
jgi:two-component system cell cycle sensor histidine kinase/response regulator CckA